MNMSPWSRSVEVAPNETFFGLTLLQQLNYVTDWDEGAGWKEGIRVREIMFQAFYDEGFVG